MNSGRAPDWSFEEDQFGRRFRTGTHDFVTKYQVARIQLRGCAGQLTDTSFCAAEVAPIFSSARAESPCP